MSVLYSSAATVVLRQTVTTPGTAQQVTAHVVPDGLAVKVTARPSNTGNFYVAFSAAAAQSSTGAREVFSFGRSSDFYVDDSSRLWVDADNSSDILEIRIPKKR